MHRIINTSMSSNNNEDRRSPPSFPTAKNNGRSSRLSEEDALYQQFMSILLDKISNNKSSRLADLSDSPEYSAERKIISGIINNGFVSGLAVGVGSFLFLRKGPRLIQGFLSRRSSHGQPTGGGYQFDMRNPSKQLIQEQRPNPAIPRPGIFLRTVKFGLDAFVSVSLGMYGWMFFTNTEKQLNDFSEIPLVEGRSMISDELCDDFIDVYRAVPKRTWDKYDKGKTVIIGQFVRNCLRRKAIEKEILDERCQFGSFGIDSDDKHVEIPHPGVPRDLAVNIQWVDKSEDLTTERDMNEFDDDDEFQNLKFDWNNEDSSEDSVGNDKDWK